MTKYLARISARRPYLIVTLWLILAVIGGGLADDAGLGLNFGFVDLLKPATTTELTLGSGAESSRADMLLEEGFGDTKPIHEIVIVQSDSLTVDDPQFRDKVVSLAAEFADLGPEIIASPPEHYFIPEVLLPLLSPEQLAQREQTVSADRKTAIMRLTIAGEFDEALENVEPVLEIVKKTNDQDDFDIFIIGDATISHEQNEIAENDLRRGEQVGIPVALVILIVLFGTVVAALMPIVLALACIIVTLGITALIGQALDLVFFITLMIIMIGLAVGIDYSLLIVSRFRDELDRGLDRQTAIERAGETAGPHRALQRRHRSHRPLRHPDSALRILPIPGSRGHPGGSGRHGRDPHPSPCQPRHPRWQDRQSFPSPSSGEGRPTPPRSPAMAFGSS